MNRLSSFRLVTAVACVAIALPARPAVAQSQASTGQIAGRVVDSSDGVLEGVAVRIFSATTGIHRVVATNEQGLYAVPLLPIGTYELSAELQGFQPLKRTGLQVALGSTLTLDLTMQVGDVVQTVDVTSSPPRLDVTSPNASTRLDATFIEKAPTNGRRFQDLVELTPHAQVEIQRGQIALSGQRGINSNIGIDGADYNQPFFGGIRGGSRSNFSPTIPQEAIREFQVIASGYSAEFGRSSGGLVNVVTKAGSNRSTGSGFYVNRPEDLAITNAFGQRSAPTQQQWGGSFGGPIKPDQVFSFLAYEQQEVNVPRAVLFDSLQGFRPSASTQEAFDYYKSLERPFTMTNDGLTFLGRLDWQLPAGSRFDVRYSGSTNTGLNAISGGNDTPATTTLALSSNGTEKDRVDTVVGQITDARRSSLLFEVRAQYAREARPREANVLEPRVQTNVGRFGTTNFLPIRTVDWRGQAAANATWMRGTHSVKTGAELNYVAVDETGGLHQTGGFTISGTSTAAILETLSVGGPTPNRFDSRTVMYLRQTGAPQRSAATTEVAAFVQDLWRIRRDLTLTYGLRWEGQWHPSPEANNDDLVNRVAGFTFPLGREVDPTFIPDALDQVAPRVGFAWDPGSNAKTVVRGNAGVYYARSPGIIFAQPLANFRFPPVDLSVQLPFQVPPDNPSQTVYQQLALIGIDLNRTPLGSLPIITPEEIEQVRQALGLSDPYSGAQLFVIDPEFRNPRAFQWGFGIERELGSGLRVGADYIDLETVKLERNVDLNLPLPVVRAGDAAQRPFFGLRDAGRQRPIASLGQVVVREASARSHYRALTLRTQWYGRWGQVYGFYVLSSSHSDDDNEADVGAMALENPYDLAPEYSAARLDRRHQASGGWVLNLPYGVEAAGNFQVRSGLPIDATFGSDANESVTGADRPYHAPGVSFTRNLFRNRPTSSVNLHLLKNVGLGGSRRLSLVLDVFNLFNASGIQLAGSEVTNYCGRPVPADCGFDAPSNSNFLQIIDRDPASATFGEYLLNNTAGEPRQIQLGVRISF